MAADVDTVISGHYPTTLAMADLKTYGDFTRDFVEAVLAARNAGRTVDEFVSEWKIPERFLREGYVDITDLRPLKPDVEVVWSESS